MIPVLVYLVRFAALMALGLVAVGGLVWLLERLDLWAHR